jgi:hypothetical protein
LASEDFRMLVWPTVDILLGSWNTWSILLAFPLILIELAR